MSGLLEEVTAQLRELAEPGRRQENARVGIVKETIGISVPALRRLSRKYRPNHDLALALWDTGGHEARQLASMVDDPAAVDGEQMERWVAEFDSWEICDGVCDLFAATPLAWHKAEAWAQREEEFVRRAAFTLVAYRAVRDKSAPDEVFLAALPWIRRASADERNFVKKALSWALRNIGKRNARLRQAATACAEELRAQGGRGRRWVAADVLRELNNPAPSVRARLERT